MTLQPNTRYVIRLMDSPSNRNVVQVLNEDETKLLTMFMAISDERLEPADKTVFTFIETGYCRSQIRVVIRGQTPIF